MPQTQHILTIHASAVATQIERKNFSATCSQSGKANNVMVYNIYYAMDHYINKWTKCIKKCEQSDIDWKAKENVSFHVIVNQEKTTVSGSSLYGVPAGLYQGHCTNTAHMMCRKNVLHKKPKTYKENNEKSVCVCGSVCVHVSFRFMYTYLEHLSVTRVNMQGKQTYIIYLIQDCHEMEARWGEHGRKWISGRSKCLSPFSFLPFLPEIWLVSPK